MVWRDEIEIDAVEYSDRPKEEGPAPPRESVERGDILLVELSDGATAYPAAFQFWREIDLDEKFTVPPRSAAGYLAWRIDDQSGHYGWLDMATVRVWLGLDSFTVDGRTYGYAEVGDDCRDKIFRNDFVDRLYSEFLEYSQEQVSDLRVASGADLVDAPATKSEVYELEGDCLGRTHTYQFQLWRPERCPVVFFAVNVRGEDAWFGERGNFHRGYIMSDIGLGISLNEATETKICGRMEELRPSDQNGLRLDGAD